jgi:hypothetical protein
MVFHQTSATPKTEIQLEVILAHRSNGNNLSRKGQHQIFGEDLK